MTKWWWLHKEKQVKVKAVHWTVTYFYTLRGVSEGSPQEEWLLATRRKQENRGKLCPRIKYLDSGIDLLGLVDLWVLVDSAESHGNWPSRVESYPTSHYLFLAVLLPDLRERVRELSCPPPFPFFFLCRVGMEPDSTRGWPSQVGLELAVFSNPCSVSFCTESHRRIRPSTLFLSFPELELHNLNPSTTWICQKHI